MKLIPLPNFKLWRLAIYGLLLIGTFGAWGCRPKKMEAPPPPPTPTPVIPAGSLVYVQRGHLVRLDLESSQNVPLTSGKSTEWFPACSPKGDQVAYWSNAEKGIYNLWMINLDGSNRLQLTFDEESALGAEEQNLLLNDSPAWSSDGKKIIYSLAGELWQMDSDGYNPETLLTGHHAFCPSFSPDGKSILFVSMGEDTVYNLWAMSLSDRSLKKLTNYSDWNVGSPSYSMDGKKIIFNLYRENQTQVYTVNDDGSNPLNLTNNNRSLCPRFALKDHKLVFCSFETGVDVGLTIDEANINGTEIKPLVTGNASSPSWAPARVVTETTPTPSPSTAGNSPTPAPAPTPIAGLPTPIGK
jgi:Tol biopolymer transport system component